jgi:threonine/homoserine efflux transporter RhtA
MIVSMLQLLVRLTSKTLPFLLESNALSAAPRSRFVDRLSRRLPTFFVD